VALIRDDTEAPPPNPGLVAASTLGAGIASGLVGGMLMLLILGAAAELDSEMTAKAGVETGVVTVPNAITSFTFNTGLEQFNDGYTWATYPGVGLLLVAALCFGTLGVALVAGVLGRNPDPLGGAFIGGLYGILIQLIVLTWIVDGMQDVDTLHSAAPAWSWWVAHIAVGVAVGVLGSALLRRASRRGDLMGAEV
jgi:hypothetical protein